jgi:predicted DNA-binding transcriptional regulator AlpA
MPTKHRITGHDLMDTAEVADAFGVTTSSVGVAMSKPHVFPALANRLPPPLRKIGKSWVWVRADIEDALKDD